MAPRCWKKTRIKSGHRHIHMCDMTRSYVGHGSIVRVAWLVHMFEMTHSDVRHPNWYIHCRWKRRESSGVESGHRRIHMCDMTHLAVRHPNFSIYLGVEKGESQVGSNRVADVFIWVTWLILMWVIPNPLYTSVWTKARIKSGIIGSPTYSHVWQDSFWCTSSQLLCISWSWGIKASRNGSQTYSYVSHDSQGRRRIHMSHMTLL